MSADLQSRLLRLQHTFQAAPRAARLEFSLGAFAFQSLHLHESWGFAAASDYVRARLGIPMSRFYDGVSSGRLLAASARAREAFLAGRLSASAAALIGRKLSTPTYDAHADELCALDVPALRRWIAAATAPPDESIATHDPEYVKVRLRLPRSAARYCEDTLRLARALCGGELPDDEAMAAVLAEASTECEFEPGTATLDEADARPARRRCASILPSASAAEARVALALLDVHEPDAARALDERLRDNLHRIDDLRVRAEDELLDAVHDELPARCGYPTLARFFRGALEIAPSTGHEYLRRALQRQRGDPLARARAAGTITMIAAVQLERLRTLGVPRSAMQAWIDEASAITVRQLHRALRWAARRSHDDLVAWASEGFRPPTSHDLRTSDISLHELLADSSPPDPGHLRDEPRDSLDLTLQREHAQLLADLTHAAGPTPRWWRIVEVFHLARSAWETNVELQSRPTNAVLERDHYRCQAPECSRARNLEVHHIHYRSHGGSDDLDNLITLCAWHHRQGEHGGRLKLRGRVTPSRDELTWELGRDENGHARLRYRGDRIQAARVN